ncbi:hypothetical protein AURDEDRAFT_149834 [Auricularia subglabra TFB-10046 SS5]|nr:hypothetical protein AURDEDRAFT_149834 [Auricularia subglabra TFB-10046 SS5]
MTRPRAQALENTKVYVDRTVYCRQDQQEERKRYKNKIKVLGGELVDEINDADIVFVHLATTTLDKTLVAVRDKIMMAEYALHCYDENTILPMQRYRVKLEPSQEPPALTHLTQRVAEHTPPSTLAPQRNTRASFRRTNLMQVASALDAPPIPSFKVPPEAPFSYAPVRDWACAVLRWFATYTPDGTDAACMRAASPCMTQIVSQILPTTFRNFYDKTPLFREHLRQVVRDARADAARKHIAGLGNLRLDGLIKDAGKAYAAAFPRLPALVADSPSARSSGSEVLEVTPPPPASPRAPRHIFSIGERGKKTVTAEGATYMQHLLRYILLSGPMRSWETMEKDVPKASNGLVSTSAFKKYRIGEGSEAMTKIRDDFERDQVAFRLKYGHDGAQDMEDKGQQTPRKRGRPEPQEEGRSIRARGRNGQYVRVWVSASSRKAAAVKSSNDEDEDWNLSG